ncbi:hypothetical protein FKM82_025080 [Ascaphus truei]
MVNLILRHSLTQLSAHKQDHPLEHLLEACPPGCSAEQRSRFQTEILQCAMEMFRAFCHRAEERQQNPEPRGACYAAAEF